jgi:hypothetical protein
MGDKFTRLSAERGLSFFSMLTWLTKGFKSEAGVVTRAQIIKAVNMLPARKTLLHKLAVTIERYGMVSIIEPFSGTANATVNKIPYRKGLCC